MEEKYKNLFKDLRPYIVTTAQTYSSLNKDFMHDKVLEPVYLDPLSSKNADFFQSILRVDKLCFGEGQMGMPNWVLFDCAFIPGVVIGFGIDSENLSKDDRESLGIKNKCFTPLSFYAATPDRQGNWFGHNLSSLNRKIQLNLDGLGFLTKLYAMGVIAADQYKGATQWNSNALHLHLKFGPLKVLSALTPIHTYVETLSYEYNSICLDLDKPYQLQTHMAPQELNRENLDKLQNEIEQGSQFLLHHLGEKQIFIEKIN